MSRSIFDDFKTFRQNIFLLDHGPNHNSSFCARAYVTSQDFKGHVITYLFYQHPPRMPSTGTEVSRSRTVLCAIEVTILVFTMKFQTEGGWWGRRGCRRTKGENRERERERRGWELCWGWKHRRNKRTVLRG